MGTRWVVRCAAAITASAVLISCGSTGTPPAKAPTSAPVVTTGAPPTTTTALRRLSPETDLEAVCEGDSFPTGAAYEGPPPHPTQAHGFGTLYGEYDEWPEPWPSWAPDKADAADIQLVLCEESQEAQLTDLVCTYSPMFEGSGGPRTLTVELEVVTLTLHRVRTGSVVAETQVLGPRECPENTSVREGETTVTSFTEVAAYAEAVRSYVLG